MSRRRTNQVIGAACAAAMLLLTAACSNGEPAPDKPDGKQPPNVAPKRTSYDPPRSFSRSRPVPLPEEAGNGKITLSGNIARPLPITLYRTTAYISAENYSSARKDRSSKSGRGSSVTDGRAAARTRAVVPALNAGGIAT